mgnify:CR=1 FL=1
MKYLLDTNICIYFLKGKYGLKEKFDNIGFDNLYVSEITVAELKYCAEKSNYPDKIRKVIQKLSSRFKLIPFFNSLDVFAKEKARLYKNEKSNKNRNWQLDQRVTTEENRCCVVYQTHYRKINRKRNRAESRPYITGLIIVYWTDRRLSDKW